MIPHNKEIRFEVTTRCNHHCIMCPRDELNRKKELMSLENFVFYLNKIHKETNQYKTVTFSGFGESTLDPTLIEKMKYARKLGYNVLLLTNGTLLTEEKFIKMNEIGVESVRISIHGNTLDSYLKTHGLKKESFFYKLKDTVTDLCNLKNRKTKIILTFVQTEYNKTNVSDFIEYWKDKVDLIEAWLPHNWVDGRAYRDVKNRDKLTTCGRPENGPLQIQVDGTINMCCFDFNGQLLLGNLMNQSLGEIFSTEPFIKLSSCHKTGNFTGSGLICEGCDQRNILKSGKEILIYNSKYNPDKRVRQYSTTYQDVSPDIPKI